MNQGPSHQHPQYWLNGNFTTFIIKQINHGSSFQLLTAVHNTKQYKMFQFQLCWAITPVTPIPQYHYIDEIQWGPFPPSNKSVMATPLWATLSWHGHHAWWWCPMGILSTMLKFIGPCHSEINSIMTKEKQIADMPTSLEYITYLMAIWWGHDMETLSPSQVLCEGKPPVTGGFPSQRASNKGLPKYLCC